MQLLLGAALVVFALVGAAADVRTRRIPNALVVAGLVTALLLRAALGPEPLSQGGAAAAIALVVGFPLFAIGAFGAGDVKFLAACATFVGLPLLLEAALFTAVAGGVLSIAVVVWRKVPLVLLLRMSELTRSVLTLGRAGGRMTIHDEGAIAAPYGVAIAAGFLFAWFGPQGGWL